MDGPIRLKESRPLARILVIDDEDAVRTPLRAVLEMAGHDVDEAADGASGLALQQDCPADLVITDLRMPAMDGCEIIRELRRSFPTTRVITMSADHNDESDALEVDGRIEKPFSLRDVLAKVAALLTEQ